MLEAYSSNREISKAHSCAHSWPAAGDLEDKERLLSEIRPARSHQPTRPIYGWYLGALRDIGTREAEIGAA